MFRSGAVGGVERPSRGLTGTVLPEARAKGCGIDALHLHAKPEYDTICCRDARADVAGEQGAVAPLRTDPHAAAARILHSANPVVIGRAAAGYTSQHVRVTVACTARQHDLGEQIDILDVDTLENPTLLCVCRCGNRAGPRHHRPGRTTVEDRPGAANIRCAPAIADGAPVAVRGDQRVRLDGQRTMEEQEQRRCSKRQCQKQVAAGEQLLPFRPP